MRDTNCLQSNVLLLPSKRLAPACAVVSQPMPSSLGSVLWRNDSCRTAALAARASTGAPAWTHSMKSSETLMLPSCICLRTAAVVVVSHVMEAALYKPVGDEQRVLQVPRFPPPSSLHTQLSSKSREIFMECPDSEASCFSSSKMGVRNKSEKGLILVDEIMNIQ